MIVTSYKQACAKGRGLACDLTEEQFDRLFLGPCYICGRAPFKIKKYSNGGSDAFIYSGIDRINNGVGYIDGNVASCCEQCNMAKRDLSLADFIAWIDTVHAHIHNIVKNNGTFKP